ncbi:MAG: methionyl-tRNA formyltransferase [Acidimicrobiia bacterium]
MTRIAFAGARIVAVRCLELLLEKGVRPELLMVPAEVSEPEARLQELSGLGRDRILAGREFREPEGIELLRSLELDYVIGVHFPYIIPESVLEIPKIGVLNLHPALLPYNRGWHTPSWAILDQTPIGATLHFMDRGVDTGDIVAQAEIEVRPEDTAHSLYRRLLALEIDLFEESWPLLASGSPPRRKQSPDEGTGHNRADLTSDSVQRLDLESSEPVGATLRTLRALTTSDLGEAAYFEAGGQRYRVQITITPEAEDEGEG